MQKPWKARGRGGQGNKEGKEKPRGCRALQTICNEDTIPNAASTALTSPQAQGSVMHSQA